MKRLIFFLVLIAGSFSAQAYISAIAIESEKNASMQVTVNGKLYNKQPGSFVRIKSNPGFFRLELKVLNPHDKVWYIVRKEVRVEKGFEFFYKVEFPPNKRPTLTLVKRYPVYSKYFWNPALYNKHPVS